MLLQDIPLTSLIVNPSNDRHGDLKLQQEAINWLLAHKTEHMKKLAEDIATQGQVYEPPLVVPLGKKYVVYDGNRRVSCLKMLDDPAQTDSPQLQKYFTKLASAAATPFWRSVTCQVETDRDKVDEILYRRHTGSQSGVGQSDWDDIAKANFVNRTGKHQTINLAEAIEARLVSHGADELSGAIPRSNLNRLLSGEATRTRIGISLQGNQLHFTHEPSAVLNALKRIADDLVKKEVVLSDIWDSNAKHRYLDRLEQDNALPEASQALPAIKSFGATAPQATHKAPPTKRVSSVPPPKPTPTRDTLIPSSINYQINWTHDSQRIRDMWDELQFHLRLDRHKNAIAVLTRVIIELSTDYCIKKIAISGVHPNDKLALKIEKTGKHLHSISLIDDKYVSELRKLSRSDEIVSSDTMNRYVHSTTFTPSPQHLVALWDTFSTYITKCLNC